MRYRQMIPDSAFGLNLLNLLEGMTRFDIVFRIEIALRKKACKKYVTMIK
jgi:hypothetical protein